MLNSTDSKITDNSDGVKSFSGNTEKKMTPEDIRKLVKDRSKERTDSAKKTTDINDYRKKNAPDEYPNVPKPEPTFDTARALLDKEFDPLNWIVSGILPEGLSLFVGKPKLGKSVFALNIGISVSTGVKALDSIPVSQGRVLYCALEDSARRLKDRLLKMLPYGHGNKSLKNLDFSTDFPEMDLGGCDRIQEYIKKYPDTQLIIIDTWGKFKPSYRNDKATYDSDYKAISRLKAIADEHHIAIMLIHHTRKMEAADAFDTVSGTLGLTGSADTIAILSRGRGDRTGILQITGRDVEESEIQMQFTPEILTWHVMSDTDKKKSETDMQNKVMNCLKESKIPLSPKEIADSEILDCKYVKNLLFRWAKKGEVFRTGRGQYTLEKPESEKADTFYNTPEIHD